MAPMRGRWFALWVALAAEGCVSTTFYGSAPSTTVAGGEYVVGSEDGEPHMWLCPMQARERQCQHVEVTQ